MTALLILLGTVAVVLATCALRAGPVRVKHYTPRFPRPQTDREVNAILEGRPWPPEDVQ